MEPMESMESQAHEQQEAQQKEAREAALDLVKTLVAKESLSDRPQWYWDQLEYDSYFRGVQNQGGVGAINGRLQFVDYSVDGSAITTDSDGDPPPDYSFNLFKRAVRMNTALFGVRSPTVRMMPINPRDPRHVQAARAANRVNRAYETVLDPQAVQSQLAFLTGKSGPVFGYTRWVSSKEYGTRHIPKLEDQEMTLTPSSYGCPACGSVGYDDDLPGMFCPECGTELTEGDFDEGLSINALLPTGETEEVLNGSVACTLHTLASVTLPPGFRRLKDCPWLFLLEERDIGVLSEVYGISASEIAGFGDVSYDTLTGRQVRSSIGSYSGTTASAHNTTKSTVGIYWLMPSQYNLIQDEGRRRMLQSMFPRGLKLTVIGAKPVRAENEALTDCWKECMPEEGDTLLMKPYAADSVGLTDIYNDAMQLNVEAVERSIPINIFDPDILSSDDLRRHGRSHASFIPSKQSGRDLSHAVQSFRAAEFRPETNVLAETIFAKHDELLGFLPIIWGSVAGAETAFETSSAKNQALAMLAIPWVMQRKFHEGQRRQAIMQIATKSDGWLHLPTSEFPEPSNAIQVATLEELDLIASGGWYPVSDEQMPISAGQIKDILRDLMSNNFPPQVQEALGLFAPMNIPLIMSYMGVPGLRSPLVEEVESVNAIRDMLLQEQPIEDGMGGMMPSQELDPFLHRPQMVLELFRPWLVSEEGRAEQEKNPGGWANVRAFAMAAEAQLQQQQMQQGPPPPSGPEGEGAPAPGPEQMPAGA